MRKLPIIVILIGIVTLTSYVVRSQKSVDLNSTVNQQTSENPAQNPGSIKISNPLEIEYMRSQVYPGSEITIEETLPSGSNYQRYIASYRSQNLKIYALLTIPDQEAPKEGFPAIVFNHGYIPPDVYRTTERYIPYTDAFSKNGYIVFKPDYRGHGESEGNPEGAYYSPAYTVDVLNAVSSIKKHPQVNPDKLGMWGHSMGGHITLRSMVTTNDIKVGVIWAGVVASYEDMANNWRRSTPWQPSTRERTTTRPNRQNLIDKYGSFEDNPQFWQSISPISFVKDVSGPIQMHHGTNDEDVPYEFSESLDAALKASGKDSELFIYQGDDHNLSHNLYTALDRSVSFFDTVLK